MKSPIAHATQLLQAGRPAEAIAPLAEAARLNPFNAAIQHDLGLACLETGRLAEAVAAFEAAIAAKPAYTDAHFRLGIARERIGDFGGAVRAYDRATECLPAHTEAWFRAGALVFTLGHVDEAVLCFRRAAASGPKTSFGRLGRARALLAENRDREAETVLRRLLALEPGHAMAQELLANVQADAGNFGEARALFAQAIERAPLLAGSYYDLVRCRSLSAEDAELVARMRAALDLPDLEPAQRVRLHLALGKAAEDLGNFGEAMGQFDAADALRGRLSTFDSAAFGAQIDRMITQYTPEFFDQPARWASDDATPIVVAGMPRSGTTLIEQIISSHPDVAAGGELNFWNDRGITWQQGVGDESAFMRQAVADYNALLRRIGPAARVTDKMPFNFLWAGLIHRAFPRATIIHCRRAAIDTALSIHQTHFNPRVAFPTGGPALVAYFRGYERLTAHWRRVLPPDRYIEVHYEDVTRDPGPHIKRIIAATGLAWHEACLHPEQNTRVVKTPSKWQARQPIYGSAVARWRRYEPWLGPLRALIA